MKRKYLPLAPLLICFIIFLSFDNNMSESSVESRKISDDEILDSLISYKNHIQPLWDKYCTRCHNENSDEVAVSLTARYSYQDLMGARYIKPFDARRSYVYSVTKGDVPNMPPQTAVDTFKMNKMEVELLKKWIEQGAKNN